MTASTVKSSQVTNADAVPVSLADSKMGGQAKVWMETYEAATTSTDETGDIIRMVRIPTNCKPYKLHIYCDDLDSHSTPALAYDVGVYRINGGAAVDVDCYASATTGGQSAVSTSPTNQLVEAMDIAKIGKYAWEQAGESADPGGYYDVCLTITTGGGTPVAGTITMVLEAATF